jgi:hypothetical protein
VKLWARNVREFCLNVDFHVTFRDLLHAAKLRHETDGFYFTSEGRRAEDFFRPKNPKALAWCVPANLDTKGQHATSKPPMPLQMPHTLPHFNISVLRRTSGRSLVMLKQQNVVYYIERAMQTKVLLQCLHAF